MRMAPSISHLPAGGFAWHAGGTRPYGATLRCSASGPRILLEEDNDRSEQSRRVFLATAAAVMPMLSLGLSAYADGPTSAYDFVLQKEEQPFPLDYLKNKYEDFAVVCVPCNQFGGQAPGTSEEEREIAIEKFKYPVTVVDKLLVNGPDADPLYKYLKAAQPVSLPNAAGKTAAQALSKDQGALEWNYTKFLCDKNGVPVKRFKSAYDPLEFEGDIRLLLAGKDVTPSECVSHPGRKVCNVDRILQGPEDA